MKQNQHFQKTACFTVTIWKIMYFHTMNKFKENDLFQENEQNEHISVKLQIPMDFQKTAFYRSGLNEQNEQFSVVLSSGHQNDHFQEIACSRLVYLNENFYIFIK